jgi:sorbose reductase
MTAPQQIPFLANNDARASLTSRTIPTMTFSTSANPLTAALPPVHTTSVQDNAIARFGIDGSAIITGGAGALALTAARALLEHGLSALCLLDLPTTLESSAQQIKQLQVDFPRSKEHSSSSKFPTIQLTIA